MLEAEKFAVGDAHANLPVHILSIVLGRKSTHTSLLSLANCIPEIVEETLEAVSVHSFVDASAGERRENVQNARRPVRLRNDGSG